ncbi:uncharacterized protein [Chelonus insularis]|uniref:uncharacterized protein isoform X2 n=1 Tax=Chelonus insularis TaxID=460826 RepID=UPI0015899673|nr:uncharacterized protein LOC118071400 isoform X2 [Chelonus insularis]
MLTGQGPKFVNKQFNSPINLYSPQAIQETLEKQTKVLANGAVGIDFNQIAKPANLQNSAVLRMLEEEEARIRNGGQPGSKRVTWPPPPEDHDEVDYIEQSPVQAKTRGIGDFVSYQSSNSSLGPSPQPISPGGTLRQPKHFQQQSSSKSWAPITPSPSTSPLPPSEQQLNLQQPAPVYQAQPAATMAPTSGVMRGDMKWPPESVKQQTEAENRARMELAKGPTFRPRRVHKDYSGFFAQHALNSSYPGYRAPPGTQYFTPSYQR